MDKRARKSALKMSVTFFAVILSIVVSGCTGVTEQDLADLQSPNAIVKREAVRRISREPAFPFSLMDFLVRRTNEKEAVTIMVELLRSGKESKDTELSILKALGELGKRAEVPAPPLIEKLENKDIHIRHQAIEVLAKTKNKEALPALEKLLQEETSKYPVVWALGEIGDQRAIPVLDRLLGSEDKYLRYKATSALAKIGKGEENGNGGSGFLRSLSFWHRDEQDENSAVSKAASASDHADSGNSLARSDGFLGSLHRDKQDENVTVDKAVIPSDRPDSGSSLAGSDGKGSTAAGGIFRFLHSLRGDKQDENVTAHKAVIRSDRPDSGSTSTDRGDLKSPGPRTRKEQAHGVFALGTEDEDEDEYGNGDLDEDEDEDSNGDLDEDEDMEDMDVDDGSSLSQIPSLSSESPTRKATQGSQQALVRTSLQGEAKTALSEAIGLQKEGRLQEAKTIYEAALKRSPNLVSALNNLGAIHIKEKNYDAARKVLEKAVEIQPNHVDPYYNLACLHAVQKNVGRSLFYLKKAISLDEAVRRWAGADEDLENLHGHSEYEKIVRGDKSA